MSLETYQQDFIHPSLVVAEVNPNEFRVIVRRNNEEGSRSSTSDPVFKQGDLLISVSPFVFEYHDDLKGRICFECGKQSSSLLTCGGCKVKKNNINITFSFILKIAEASFVPFNKYNKFYFIILSIKLTH